MPQAPTTAYLDTENAFHWTHPEPDKANRGRKQSLNRLNEAQWGEPVRNPRRAIELMALGGAVFERLTQWLAGGPSEIVDLRSYGKVDDPGVEVVAHLISHREVAPTAGAGEWVHVGVGLGNETADVALARDLWDRTHRTEPQRFYILSSDQGEVLSWCAAIAAEAPAHSYRVILGPTMLDPHVFEEGGSLERLKYSGTVAELFAQVVRREKEIKTGISPEDSKVPLRLTTSARDLSWRFARQQLSGSGLTAYLKDAQNPSEFRQRLSRRANQLDGLPGLTWDEKERIHERWPAAVLTGWRQFKPERADAPAYAAVEHIPTLIRRAKGHIALNALAASIRRALVDPDEATDALSTLAQAEDEKRAQLGPAQHAP